MASIVCHGRAPWVDLQLVQVLCVVRQGMLVLGIGVGETAAMVAGWSSGRSSWFRCYGPRDSVHGLPVGVSGCKHHSEAINLMDCSLHPMNLAWEWCGHKLLLVKKKMAWAGLFNLISLGN